MDGETIYKEDIDGVKYQHCEELGIDYVVAGEQADFPCSGYILDINPIDNDPTTFVE